MNIVFGVCVLVGMITGFIGATIEDGPISGIAFSLIGGIAGLLLALAISLISGLIK